MLSCECDYGFDCTYTKSVRGKVVLPVTPENFDENMRISFINAVAEAAGVWFSLVFKGNVHNLTPFLQE
jgi:hypothetical protein